MAGSGKRSGWVKGTAIVVGLLIVYVAVLAAYAAGDSGDDSDTRQPAANGVLVYIDIDAVNGAAFEIAGHVSVYAGGDLLDARGDLKEDLTIDVSPLVSSTDLQFAAGSRPGTLPVSLYSDGDIRLWPFDSYVSESVTVQAYGPNDAELPTEVALTDSLIGWDVSAGGSVSAGGAGSHGHLDEDGRIPDVRSRAVRNAGRPADLHTFRLDTNGAAPQGIPASDGHLVRGDVVCRAASPQHLSRYAPRSARGSITRWCCGFSAALSRRWRCTSSPGGSRLPDARRVGPAESSAG